MNIDKKLDRLKKIEAVEAPHFLYTRIRARIDALAEAPAPVKWMWNFAAAAVVVLALNTGILLTASSSSEEKSDVGTVVSTMQLASTTTFYDE